MRRILWVLLVAAIPFSASQGYNVSGNVSGGQGIALIFVYAVPVSFDTFYVSVANIFNGNYTVSNMDSGGYVLFAFQDVDISLTPGLDEPRGFYGGEVPEVLTVTENLSGIDIELLPPNTGGFSGEITYDGGETGLTTVVAYRTSDFTGLPSGVGALLNDTGNGSYVAVVDSFGVYYAYAYMDLNTNLQYDPGEPWDIYGDETPVPIQIEQGEGYPDNVNFVLEAQSAAPPVVPVIREFSLGAPYPNPFNAETTIPFSLERPMYVELVARDVLGREVLPIVQGELSAGEHAVKFGNSTLASGVYMLELRAGQASQTVPVILLK
ncbi:MAG: T9SS type A sorting domain-containing protein [Calditrichaeota bacterium]|nr:T9SS type A sorting domain-containing protein [Calditrichota bacterium]MCB9365634.1 T9SS type A sorting domain-containing protein [Calditrichota bacterium]